MADILRVTSPVINKNIIQPDRAQKDPSVPFDMQEIRHITKNPSLCAKEAFKRFYDPHFRVDDEVYKVLNMRRDDRKM